VAPIGLFCCFRPSRTKLSSTRRDHTGRLLLALTQPGCDAQATDAPKFVYAAFFGTLVLFATFAINSYLHHIQGRYDFHTAEVRALRLAGQ
jgi:hypothetical protein